MALAIGLLVGSERERSRAGDTPAGVRTFALAALAGCLAALAGTAVLAAVTVAAAGLVAVGYARTSARDPGATTEIALVLTVLLGGVAVSRPALAAGAGVATAIVLVSKDRLHRFVRQTVSDVEVTDALKFFVVAFIVLPLVPHARVGPYGAIDPRRIWTLVVAVTALGWLGYLAVRTLGPGRGLPVAGLAGGFVSGAATTGAMARQAREPRLRRPGLAGALLASVATLVQLVLVTAVADRRVALLLAPAAAAGVGVLAVEAYFLARRRAPSTVEGVAESRAVDVDRVEPPSAAPDEAAEAQPPAAAPAARRPFALVPALVLAALLTVMLVVGAFAGDVFGSRGAILAISAAGLADAHAGALTAASLSASDELPVTTAVAAAMAAVGVNTIVKFVLALAAGGRRLAGQFAVLIAGPVVAVVAALLITLAVTG